MIVRTADDRAKDGKLVHSGGQARQMFAYVHAWNSAGRRTELAPDLKGCLRLKVIQVEV
jgi:hypothetical protein